MIENRNGIFRLLPFAPFTVPAKGGHVREPFRREMGAICISCRFVEVLNCACVRLEIVGELTGRSEVRQPYTTRVNARIWIWVIRNTQRSSVAQFNPYSFTLYAKERPFAGHLSTVLGIGDLEQQD